MGKKCLIFAPIGMSRRKDAWVHDSVCASFPGRWMWGFGATKGVAWGVPNELAAKSRDGSYESAGSVETSLIAQQSVVQSIPKHL